MILTNYYLKPAKQTWAGLTRLNMLFSPTLPQLENAVQQTEQPAKQYAQQHAE